MFFLILKLVIHPCNTCLVYYKDQRHLSRRVHMRGVLRICSGFWGECLWRHVISVLKSARKVFKKVYLRLAEEKWKSRFYNHKLSFKDKRYSNKTTLLSYMCHLKSISSKTTNFKWSILRCVPPYSNISKKCVLCLYEKLEIVTYQNQKEPLNKRSELLFKCRHTNKFLLKNYTGNNDIR